MQRHLKPCAFSSFSFSLSRTRESAGERVRPNARLQWNVALFTLLLISTLRAAPVPTQPSRLSYLDNGAIRIGVNLAAGGAITYLSTSTGDNLVNNFDWGRQIQMSNYSGPVPFAPGGKQPAPAWKMLGWNPVQAGDCYHHPSRILDSSNDGKTLTVTCIPMQWPLDNVPAECTFHTEIQLDKNTVHITCRLENHRSDHTQYPARGQELPALYTIGKLYRLFTYTGAKPFTRDALKQITSPTSQPPTPWSRWLGTENFAALVNDDNFGVGIFTPGTFDFAGGFYGTKNTGGTHDDPTGYIGPVREEILDHNIIYTYDYTLIVGSLDQIRDVVYAKAPRPAAPTFRFDHDRQSWRYLDAADTGFPIKQFLNVHTIGKDPQLLSPTIFFAANEAPKLKLDAAFNTHQSSAQLFFRRYDDNNYSAEKCVTFPIRADDQFHTYTVDLTASPQYHGLITGIRLDPPEGDLRVRSISLSRD